MSDAERTLDRFAVVIETESGRTIDLCTTVEDWLSWTVSDHVDGLGRPGYRDGTVEIMMGVEKWGDQGHCVASLTPQQAKAFVDEVAAAIDCDVIPSERVEDEL